MTSTPRPETITSRELVAGFLRRVQGQTRRLIDEAPACERERIGRFLDPAVVVPGAEAQAATPWIHTDPALMATVRGLVALVLADRSLSPEEQLALMDGLRLRSEQFRRHEVRWSRDSLERIFTSSPLPMLLFDAGGRLVFCNAAADRMVGYDIKARLGDTSILELLPSAGGPALAENMRRALQGEPVGASGARYRSSVTGQELIVSMQAFPIFDVGGDLAYSCIVISNETERTTLARSLDLSRRVLAGIVDAIGDPVLRCDASGRVLSYNRAAAEVLALSPSDVSRPLSAIVARAGGRLAREDLDELVESGEELELRLSGRGEPVPYGVRVEEMPPGVDDDGGGPTRVVVMRDMRLELERQHALRASKEQLEQVNRELRHLNEAKVEFMNIVSHELRSPLVTIHGYIEMILREGLGPVSDGQRAGLTVALRNAIRLTDQIETLLDFSRIEQGRIRFSLGPVDIREVVRKASESIQHAVGQQDLTFQLDVKVPDRTMVLADADKLRRIIRVLLDNAVKFTPEGSVGLEVRPVARAEGPRIEVAVWDTGVGIAPAHLSRVFDTFYQVPTSSGGRARGTGLGLSVARSLVEGHGGELVVESEPSIGSRFSFDLKPASHHTKPDRS